MLSEEPKDILGVYTVEPVSNWESLYEVAGDFPAENWIFRGQESSEWVLKSTFERARPDLTNEYPAWKYEAAILREFTRRAHHFIPDPPISKDVLEWFSLMRHYGAPCRLLDFTYSFYIAAYFAFKKAKEENRYAAIWAINKDWLVKQYPIEAEEDFDCKNPKDFYRYFLNHEKPYNFVASVNPFRLNPRLTAQRGVFLCPGNIAESFMNNLLAKDKEEGEQKLVRIPLASSMKKDAIRALWGMNINSATLFPDLAGFAEYLTDWFYLPLNFSDENLIASLEGRFPSDERLQ